MTEDASLLPGELLRNAMRHWVSGVAVVTSCFKGTRHGMTVNSLVSISLDPPLVAVTLANNTRTHRLVQQSGQLGITILSQAQAQLSDIFAGKVSENGDRFAGLEIFSLSSGVPLLAGGLAWLDCQVAFEHSMPHSTLFLGEVVAARLGPGGDPLVYFNRAYHKGIG